VHTDWEQKWQFPAVPVAVAALVGGRLVTVGLAGHATSDQRSEDGLGIFLIPVNLVNIELENKGQKCIDRIWCNS
jgi:hypothetical protein